jgi:transcriptional regulator with XRE-family HTH domain
MPWTVLRDARRAAGLTQAELAARLGTTQSAIARLEARGANPCFGTLARAVSACGHDLVIDIRPSKASVDESQIRERLTLTAAQRLTSFDQSYASLRQLALAGRRARGELA